MPDTQHNYTVDVGVSSENRKQPLNCPIILITLPVSESLVLNCYVFLVITSPGKSALMFYKIISIPDAYVYAEIFYESYT